jgi:hypothetical protein
MYQDYIFKIIVYCVSIYFILVENSISVNFCGWTILVAHIYKDTTNLVKWPYWCEIFGIFLSILLITGGIEINNNFVLVVGGLKFLAHLRQIILNDDRYYY